MSEQTFKPGDIVKHKLTGEELIVIPWGWGEWSPSGFIRLRTAGGYEVTRHPVELVALNDMTHKADDDNVERRDRASLTTMTIHPCYNGYDFDDTEVVPTEDGLEVGCSTIPWEWIDSVRPFFRP